MGRAPSLHPEQREEALRRLGEGEAQTSIAMRLGVSKDAIYRLAKEYEIPSTAVRRERQEARRDFHRANRIALCNKGFDKLEDMLPVIQDPQKIYQWSLAFGILTDKRLLEDTHTAPEKAADATDALADLALKLEEIEERKRRAASVN